MEADRSGSDKVKCAILDTNVLMYIYLKKVDIIGQLRELGFKKIIVPKCVIDELKKLEISLTGKERKAAKFALKLIEGAEFDIVECERKSDDALLQIAQQNGCYLITNDKALKKRARDLGIPLGYLRELNRIELSDDF